MWLRRLFPWDICISFRFFSWRVFSRDPWIAFVVVICAALTVISSRYDLRPAIILFVMSSAWICGDGIVCLRNCAATGRKRLQYVHEMETQIRLRHETEGQLKGLVESSPLAIITIDANGRILLANDAAQNLFARRRCLQSRAKPSQNFFRPCKQ